MNLHKPIMTLILLPTILILAGCAGQAKVKPPSWHNVARPVIEITDPVELPLLCEITVIQDAEGVKHGTWSPECWKALQSYEIVSEGNVEIAGLNADALRKTEAGYNAAISAGQIQQELTFFYVDLLEEERSSRFWDGVIFKSIIGAGLLIAIP